MAGAVLVQAEDSLVDTQFMLDVATANPWVWGVVGWVNLENPAEAEASLDRWQQHPAFVGVRHLVHDDPRDDFLSLSGVRDSLRLLAARGFAFDVPNAWPRHLNAVADLARDIPAHRGDRPPGQAAARHGCLPEWERRLRAAAALPNTVAKFSGLGAENEPFTTDALRGVWDVALEHSGQRASCTAATGR